MTAHARIRNAGLELFAELGYERTTVRAIASRAHVSPALVLHHFGSKDGLRAACDEHLLDVMRSQKTAAFAGIAPLSLAALVEESPQFHAPLAYLIRLLTDGGELAGVLFERMVSDVESYLALGEKAGTVAPTPDPASRAAVTTAFSLGAMVFERHIARHLGGTTLFDRDVYLRYSRSALELYTQGLLSRPIVQDDLEPTLRPSEHMQPPDHMQED